MVRTSEHKYNLYSNGEEQLYQLTEDPGELSNLASDPSAQAIVQQHRQLLTQWMTKSSDTFEVE